MTYGPEKVGSGSTTPRHLPKETGVELAPSTQNLRKMAQFRGFYEHFEKFQWIALHPDDHSKFREIVRLPRRVYEPEKYAL